MKGPLVLASASPRREQILGQAGLSFVVIPSAVEEEGWVGVPETYVARMAMAKAAQVAGGLATGLVLAADTAVVNGSAVLGKPRSEAEALTMLRRLRGRRHRVLTGVAVVNASTGWALSQVAQSWVTMRRYTDAEARAFVARGEAGDKAGAYAIQDSLFCPVALVEGCYLNVVGLPLCVAIDLLQQAGASVGRIPSPRECPECPLRLAAPQLTVPGVER